jgi:hypothetical protein
MAHPYAISIDWLQIYFHKPSGFEFSDQNPDGYNYAKKDYGTKIFKDVYTVVEPTGEILGTITSTPYSSALPQNMCLLKLENRVLYQSDYMRRVFEFSSRENFFYKGITRIDICYDCNEYANGLNPYHLISRYLNQEYLKVGLNKVALDARFTYKFGEKDQVLPKESTITAPVIEGLRWGSRKHDVNVAIYNKSQEMVDVEMKHYIMDYWRVCGLDLNRPVYRTEIRINNQGRGIEELETGVLFSLSLDDLVTQSTIEHMFHTYAHKYCRFYVRDYHVKAQQMERLKIFAPMDKINLRPKRLTHKKNYTRMHKVMINNLARHIYENAAEGTTLTGYLEKVKDYFIEAYGLERWAEKQGIFEANISAAAKAKEDDLREYQERRDGSYYLNKYAHYASDTARRAAEMRKSIDDRIDRERSESWQEFIHRRNTGEAATIPMEWSNAIADINRRAELTRREPLPKLKKILQQLPWELDTIGEDPPF